MCERNPTGAFLEQIFHCHLFGIRLLLLLARGRTVVLSDVVRRQDEFDGQCQRGERVLIDQCREVR